MRHAIMFWLGISAWLAGAAAHGHHSFAAHFVSDELVTVAGVVREFRFRNPHGLLTLEAVDADGNAELWRVETNAPTILRRRGWTPDSIKAGDDVTIVGFPARDGSKQMRIYRVLFADGRELTGQRPDVGVADSQD